MIATDVWLALLFAIIAAVYAAAGGGGGSGYLAVMALAGLPAAAMKPTALTLNVLVTAISSGRFMRTGHFNGRLFWSIALPAVPLSFLGGRLSLPEAVYRPVVGAILLYAAWHLWRGGRRGARLPVATPPLWQRAGVGAAIGLLSGVLGLGGAIFLTPILLLGGWTAPRATIAITAPFVLTTSAAGLIGHLSTMAALPQALGWWLAAAAAGSATGAYAATTWLSPIQLRRLMALILLLGGARLIIAG